MNHRAELQLVEPQHYDNEAGGTPSAVSSIALREFGFSNLPAVSYHYAVIDTLTLGARFSFDYAAYVPAQVFLRSVFLEAPIRWSVLRRGKVTLGVHFDPGFGFTFTRGNAFIGSAADFVLLLGAGGNVGYHIVANKIVVGGGLDMPVMIDFPIGIGFTALHWPILLGPIFEVHPSDALAITFDTKFGPMFSAPLAVAFAMKLVFGVAYRF